MVRNAYVHGFGWVIFLGAACRAAAAPGAEAACTQIVDDPARLACYDSTFGHVLAKPPAHGAPAGADQFGDNGQLRRDRNAKSALPKSVTDRVAHMTPMASGLYRLILDNQQIWQTTQSDWALEFKTGDRVTIVRLPLGGYQITVVGNPRSVSAKRLE
jgi:hypothetical protein